MVRVLSILLSFCFVASVHLSSENEEMLDKDLLSFEEWQRLYGKSYSHNEKRLREKIFNEKTEIIKEHNKRYKAGEVTYMMGQNKFSDLTKDEFNALMIKDSFKSFEGFNFTNVEPTGRHRVKRSAPSSFDWRTSSKVVAAQDQGWCGSGYAFAAIGAVESQYAIKTGNLVKLSAEEIVECSGPQGNSNCTSGTAENAYRYMISTGQTVSLNAQYPYTSGANGDVGPCLKNSAMVSKVKVKSFTRLVSGENNLRDAVYNYGPITTYMSVNYQSFFDYLSGVWSDPSCINTPDHADHYMLVIGYGSNGAGQDYWVVKNSWSTSWGIDGIIKVARNANNMCGIANILSYPTIDTSIL